MRIGIDLGGTKIEGLAMDSHGTTLARRRISTPSGDYPGTIAAIADLVTALETDTGRRGSIGIGIPGSLSPGTGRVRNANSTCLIGHLLEQDLSERLVRPVRVANDADCFALSEATDGAGAGADSVFGVILGTGVGAGIVIKGQLLSGANRIAGEWGHNPLPFDDPSPPPCYCGRQGCIETYLSGPGLSRQYRRAGGEQLDAPTLVVRADAGEPLAAKVLCVYYEHLAAALATVINILDPEVIVLGGGLSQIGPLYREVPQRWSRYIFSDSVTTRLSPPRFGDASGVRGAAWLWSLSEINGR